MEKSKGNGWLVLLRKIDEEVVVTDEWGNRLLTIRVVEFPGREKVRLGFQAPDRIKIVRREILDPEKKKK